MSRESEAILEALRRLGTGGRPGAMATLIHTWGSTYRRPGARMVIGPDGPLAGTLSGGCLEGDVTEIARGVMETRRPVLARYDLSEDQVWSLGLGCGGGVEVLIEPLDAPRVAAALEVRDLDGARRLAGALAPDSLVVAGLSSLAAGETVAVVTAFTPPEGYSGTEAQGARELAGLARMVLWQKEGGVGDGDLGNVEVLGSLGDEELTAWALREGRERLARGANPRDATLSPPGGSPRVFFDLLRPAPRLLLLGAGHDAIPVVQVAASAGFRVVVADPRPGFATAQRFPGAEQVLVCEPAQTREQVPLTQRDYVLIMNHHKQRDREALQTWWEGPPAYVGILGPRRRTQEMLEDLGIHPVPPRLYFPVGLDLGSETPEEIALSIVAEMLAHRNERRGGPLRERPGSIH